MPPLRPTSKVGLPIPGRPVSKIGVPNTPALTDRTKASPVMSASSGTGSDSPSEYFTYFTQVPGTGQAGTQILYTANRIWADVTVMLETAGPVAVGSADNLQPVLGGAGILLQPNIPRTFRLAQGSRLFIASTSVNRVSVQIDPVPWLYTITSKLSQGLDLLTQIFGALTAKK